MKLAQTDRTAIHETTYHGLTKGTRTEETIKDKSRTRLEKKVVGDDDDDDLDAQHEDVE